MAPPDNREVCPSLALAEAVRRPDVAAYSLDADAVRGHMLSCRDQVPWNLISIENDAPKRAVHVGLEP